MTTHEKRLTIISIMTDSKNRETALVLTTKDEVFQLATSLIRCYGEMK